MLPDEDFVRELTRSVWDAVVGLPVEDGDVAALEGRQIVTSVDIEGPWSGTVSISLSDTLGKRLAAAMLQCPEADTTEVLVKDAMGELANVIGGNVKGMFPGPSTLSLPRVRVRAHGERGSVAPASSVDAASQSLWFACEGSPFRVSVRPVTDTSELK